MTQKKVPTISSAISRPRVRQTSVPIYLTVLGTEISLIFQWDKMEEEVEEKEDENLILDLPCRLNAW